MANSAGSTVEEVLASSCDEAIDVPILVPISQPMPNTVEDLFAGTSAVELIQTAPDGAPLDMSDLFDLGPSYLSINDPSEETEGTYVSHADDVFSPPRPVKSSRSIVNGKKIPRTKKQKIKKPESQYSNDPAVPLSDIHFWEEWYDAEFCDNEDWFDQLMASTQSQPGPSRNNIDISKKKSSKTKHTSTTISESILTTGDDFSSSLSTTVTHTITSSYVTPAANVSAASAVTAPKTRKQPAKETVTTKNRKRPAKDTVKKQKPIRPAKETVTTKNRKRPAKVTVKKQKPIRPAKETVTTKNRKRPAKDAVTKQKPIRRAKESVTAKNRKQPAKDAVTKQKPIRPAKETVTTKNRKRPAKDAVTKQKPIRPAKEAVTTKTAIRERYNTAARTRAFVAKARLISETKTLQSDDIFTAPPTVTSPSLVSESSLFVAPILSQTSSSLPILADDVYTLTTTSQPPPVFPVNAHESVAGSDYLYTSKYTPDTIESTVSYDEFSFPTTAIVTKAAPQDIWSAPLTTSKSPVPSKQIKVHADVPQLQNRFNVSGSSKQRTESWNQYLMPVLGSTTNAYADVSHTISFTNTSDIMTEVPSCSSLSHVSESSLFVAPILSQTSSSLPILADDVYTLTTAARTRAFVAKARLISETITLQSDDIFTAPPTVTSPSLVSESSLFVAPILSQTSSSLPILADDVYTLTTTSQPPPVFPVNAHESVAGSDYLYTSKYTPDTIESTVSYDEFSFPTTAIVTKAAPQEIWSAPLTTSKSPVPSKQIKVHADVPQLQNRFNVSGSSKQRTESWNQYLMPVLGSTTNAYADVSHTISFTNTSDIMTEVPSCSSPSHVSESSLFVAPILSQTSSSLPILADDVYTLTTTSQPPPVFPVNAHESVAGSDYLYTSKYTPDTIESTVSYDEFSFPTTAIVTKAAPQEIWSAPLTTSKSPVPSKQIKVHADVPQLQNRFNVSGSSKQRTESWNQYLMPVLGSTTNAYADVSHTISFTNTSDIMTEVPSCSSPSHVSESSLFVAPILSQTSSSLPILADDVYTLTTTSQPPPVFPVNAHESVAGSDYLYTSKYTPDTIESTVSYDEFSFPTAAIVTKAAPQEIWSAPLTTSKSPVPSKQIKVHADVPQLQNRFNVSGSSKQRTESWNQYLMPVLGSTTNAYADVSHTISLTNTSDIMTEVTSCTSPSLVSKSSLFVAPILSQTSSSLPVLADDVYTLTTTSQPPPVFPVNAHESVAVSDHLYTSKYTPVTIESTVSYDEFSFPTTTVAIVTKAAPREVWSAPLRTSKSPVPSKQIKVLADVPQLQNRFNVSGSSKQRTGSRNQYLMPVLGSTTNAYADVSHTISLTNTSDIMTEVTSCTSPSLVSESSLFVAPILSQTSSSLPVLADDVYTLTTTSQPPPVFPVNAHESVAVSDHLYTSKYTPVTIESTVSYDEFSFPTTTVAIVTKAAPREVWSAPLRTSKSPVPSKQIKVLADVPQLQNRFNVSGSSKQRTGSRNQYLMPVLGSTTNAYADVSHTISLTNTSDIMTEVTSCTSPSLVSESSLFVAPILSQTSSSLPVLADDVYTLTTTSQPPPVFPVNAHESVAVSDHLYTSKYTPVTIESTVSYDEFSFPTTTVAIVTKAAPREVWSAPLRTSKSPVPSKQIKVLADVPQLQNKVNVSGSSKQRTGSRNQYLMPALGSTTNAYANVSHTISLTNTSNIMTEVPSCTSFFATQLTPASCSLVPSVGPTTIAKTRRPIVISKKACIMVKRRSTSNESVKFINSSVLNVADTDSLPLSHLSATRAENTSLASLLNMASYSFVPASTQVTYATTSNVTLFTASTTTSDSVTRSRSCAISSIASVPAAGNTLFSQYTIPVVSYVASTQVNMDTTTIQSENLIGTNLCAYSTATISSDYLDGAPRLCLPTATTISIMSPISVPTTAIYSADIYSSAALQHTQSRKNVRLQKRTVSSTVTENIAVMRNVVPTYTVMTNFGPITTASIHQPAHKMSHGVSTYDSAVYKEEFVQSNTNDYLQGQISTDPPEVSTETVSSIVPQTESAIPVAVPTIVPSTGALPLGQRFIIKFTPNPLTTTSVTTALTSRPIPSTTSIPHSDNVISRDVTLLRVPRTLAINKLPTVVSVPSRPGSGTVPIRKNIQPRQVNKKVVNHPGPLQIFADVVRSPAITPSASTTSAPSPSHYTSYSQTSGTSTFIVPQYRNTACKNFSTVAHTSHSPRPGTSIASERTVVRRPMAFFSSQIPLRSGQSILANICTPMTQAQTVESSAAFPIPKDAKR